MPQYHYTGVSDQKLQNKIRKKKKKNSHIFIIRDIDDVFEITLPFHASNWRFYNTISFFYNSMPPMQSTGRAMNKQGPYEKDIRVFMRVCRRMSLDTCAWYFSTMSPYL